ncbi:hypothetical protein GCM10009854_48780 [Saccharopolyspora halophila]|uniref:Uncharacterized protein n=1 Tax=Saccharopolyspora halophila TaxID=405551 RepID=A0ABN3GWZ1_9PSEU
MAENVEFSDSLTSEQQELAVELVVRARDEGVELTDPDGLLTGATRSIPKKQFKASARAVRLMSSIPSQ